MSTAEPVPGESEAHEMCPVNPDDFGLPANILGLHPDEFYGAIGRIVLSSAVLEDKVTTLRHGLAGVPQGQHSQQPVSKQIEVAHAIAAGLPDPARELVSEFLSRAENAFRRRNDLVHSSFPAQPDGRLWGHRPTRDKSVMDGTADTAETSIAELRDFVRELAELVEGFNHVAAAITIRPAGT